MQSLKKRSKLGFTLTELAIVIAVIAILIAVLVPTFTSLINKTNETVDQQAVRNMNTALATEEALTQEEPETLCDVWAVLQRYGYNASSYSALSSGNGFYWYVAKNRIVIVNSGAITYPGEYTEDTYVNLKSDFIALDTDSKDESAHNYDSKTGLCNNCGTSGGTVSYDVTPEECFDIDTNDDGNNTCTITAYDATSNTNNGGTGEIINFPSTIEKDGTTYTVTQIGLADASNPDSVICGKMVGVSDTGNYINTIFTDISTNYSNNFSYLSDYATWIESSMYNLDTTVTTVIIPDTVTKINKGAFAGCAELTTVSIPDGVTSIGENAFWYCFSLETINIPYTVTSIGASAFMACSKLTNVTFETGNSDSQLYKIDANAFTMCALLESIVIPSTVTNLNSYAFSNGNEESLITPCEYLYGSKTIYYNSGEPTYNSPYKDYGYTFGATPITAVYCLATSYNSSLGDSITSGATGGTATIYYFNTAGDYSASDGHKYWRYVNGVPTAWN